jgi:hypothetical protein
MIIIVIELIDDSDPKGIGIGEAAIVDAGDIKMLRESEIAFGLEDGIDFHQPFPDKIPMTHIIDNSLPQCVLALLVKKGNGGDKMNEIPVGNRDFYFPPVFFKVFAQTFIDLEDGLFL